jgi:hypothetical protein
MATLENGKKYSFSGIVRKIKIRDVICDTYRQIFDELKIKQITFIDTYGLDHDENISPEKIQKRFVDVFTEHPKIENIFYIRALTTSSPGDLKITIPAIYSANSRAVLYPVLTKIGDNPIVKDKFNSGVVDLIELNNNDTLQAVEYFLETIEGIPHEIEKKMKEEDIPPKIAKHLFEYVQKSITPYSSKNNEKYIDSNLHYVKERFKAIINKEHMYKEEISINELKASLGELNNADSEGAEMLDRLLDSFFKVANQDDWGSEMGGSNKLHYAVNRIMADECQGKNLGYWATNNNLWSTYFVNAYNATFSKQKHSDFQKIFGDGESAVAAYLTLAQLLNDFITSLIGCREENAPRFKDSAHECKSDCDKECFRKLLLSIFGDDFYLTANEKTLRETEQNYTYNNRVSGGIHQKYQGNKEEVRKFVISRLEDDFVELCQGHNWRMIKNQFLSNNENAEAVFDGIIDAVRKEKKNVLSSLHFNDIVEFLEKTQLLPVKYS